MRNDTQWPAADNVAPRWKLWMRTLLVCGMLMINALTSVVGHDVFAIAEEPVHAGGIEFRFASREQARSILEQQDAFIQSLSRFDRMARMGTTTDPGASKFVEFVANEVIEWAPAERAAIRKALEQLRERLQGLQLRLNGQITLIHTTGREESGAAYTRGWAIILPRGMTGSAERPPLRLISHELFHVLSRSNPEMRDRLYEVIGFHPTGLIRLPDDLADRKITNPDAPQIEHAIDVQLSDTKKAKLAPVLLANRDYGPEQPAFFRYLEFKLMELHRDAESGWVPRLVDGKPVFHEPSLPDFHRQIGSNTAYIIHPDEILADNFALLITGEQARDPWIIDKMREVLSDAAKGED